MFAGGFWVGFGFLGLILVFIICMLFGVLVCGLGFRVVDFGVVYLLFLWMFWVVCFKFVGLGRFVGFCVLLGLI